MTLDDFCEGECSSLDSFEDNFPSSEKIDKELFIKVGDEYFFRASYKKPSIFEKFGNEVYDTFSKLVNYFKN